MVDFQKKQDITADGIVGNQTLSTLGAVAATKNAPEYVKTAAVTSAKKTPTGAINPNTILM